MILWYVINHYQIPDFETPYSRTTFPNPNHCAIEPKDQNISAIITDHHQQLDATLHDISILQIVIGKFTNNWPNRRKRSSRPSRRTRDLSPLWHLPTEVLPYFFVCCLPESKYLSPSLTQAPVLLTRICRRWRAVAMGTPNLCCRLDVPCDLGRRQEQLLFSLDLSLKRS